MNYITKGAAVTHAEITVLVQSLKSSNAKLDLYLDERLFKCLLTLKAG